MITNCSRRFWKNRTLLIAAVGSALVLGACHEVAIPPGQISVVGAESQYASVLAQIGGRYVHASAVLDNPAADPHSFEVSASVAQLVDGARLVLQNGLGYDTFMSDLEGATPNSDRHVIVAGRFASSAAAASINPHVWYDPYAMDRVASAVASELSKIEPAHAAYFRSRLRAFQSATRADIVLVASFRTVHPHVRVATTEPIANYLLRDMGMSVATPRQFQADVMNGIDPSAQDAAAVQGLLTNGDVKLLCFNRQVADTLTSSLVDLAHSSGVPVVGVYETMPPGTDYPRWMLDTARAIARAAVGDFGSRGIV